MQLLKKDFLQGATTYVETVEQVHHIQLIADESLLKEYFRRSKHLTLPQYVELDRPLQLVAQFQLDIAACLVLPLARRVIRTGDVVVLSLEQGERKFNWHKFEEEELRSHHHHPQNPQQVICDGDHYMNNGHRGLFLEQEQPGLRQRPAYKRLDEVDVPHYYHFPLPLTKPPLDAPESTGFTPISKTRRLLLRLSDFVERFVTWFAQCNE